MIQDKLSDNARAILEMRYLQDNELPSELFMRVARSVAQGEQTALDTTRYTNEFYLMMMDLDFLPNSPTLVNAGRSSRGSLSACFTMSPEDTAESILQVASDACMVEKWGGGIGFGFSNLRPKVDKISTTH